MAVTQPLGFMWLSASIDRAQLVPNPDWEIEWGAFAPSLVVCAAHAINLDKAITLAYRANSAWVWCEAFSSPHPELPRFGHLFGSQDILAVSDNVDMVRVDTPPVAAQVVTFHATRDDYPNKPETELVGSDGLLTPVDLLLFGEGVATVSVGSDMASPPPAPRRQYSNLRPEASDGVVVNLDRSV